MQQLTVKVRLPKELVPWWWRFAYKIPPPIAENLVELLDAPVDERFTELVAENVRALVEEGKPPPAEISTAIYNIANDFMNGEELVIRAGDWIALQSYCRR